MENNPISVSEAIALINQTFEYAYPLLIIEGEISSFKVNQGKFVFFDLKDDSGTLGCFMMVFQLRTPIEDGMRVQVVASPKLTQWGRFSLTVREIRPVGQGSIKRSFTLLVEKLQKEGLFNPERKRPLPELPGHIGVISSTAAAGYIDFISILNNRWGGMRVSVANVQVQGNPAPRQIINAIKYFNESSEPPEIIVIVRGGGSADDLSVFNDEPLARAIAASRVPTLVGVGHEVDTTLADMVADVRAATPSNAAVLLVPDRSELLARQHYLLGGALASIERRHARINELMNAATALPAARLANKYEQLAFALDRTIFALKQLNPYNVLKRGYALVKDQNAHIVKGEANGLNVGQRTTIQTSKAIIEAGVTHVEQSNQ